MLCPDLDAEADEERRGCQRRACEARWVDCSGGGGDGRKHGAIANETPCANVHLGWVEHAELGDAPRDSCALQSVQQSNIGAVALHAHADTDGALRRNGLSAAAPAESTEAVPPLAEQSPRECRTEQVLPLQQLQERGALGKAVEAEVSAACIGAHGARKPTPRSQPTSPAQSVSASSQRQTLICAARAMYSICAPCIASARHV